MVATAVLSFAQRFVMAWSPGDAWRCSWLLAGCESTVSTGADREPARARRQGGGARRRRQGDAGVQVRHRQPGKSQAKVVSTIEGDRMTVVAPPVVLTKQTESSPFRFAEIAKEAGIDFVHFSGMTEEKHFPTANGSGVAIFDYDNDGLIDIYFATATLLPLGTAVKGPNRLYKNLGNGKFKDVTEASGLGFRGFCHGIIVGDIDNDGDQDVFLCNYGPNVLYLNNGNGTFKDISKSAGIDAPNWSSGGAMLDYDNDGDLDIYVANYGRWNYPEDHQRVGDLEKKIWLYSSPRTIKTVKHMFYRNNGDLTFTDVYDKVITVEKDESSGRRRRSTRRPSRRRRSTSRSSECPSRERRPRLRRGHGRPQRRRPDRHLRRQRHEPELPVPEPGRRHVRRRLRGLGRGLRHQRHGPVGHGRRRRGRRRRRLPELFVTNFANEYNTLYQNFGKGVFFDNTAFFGLASDTMPFVNWGTAFVDFDNDGWPDNFVANGHVDDNRRQLGQPVDYEQIPLLFRNLEGKRFRLSTRDVGPYFDTEPRRPGRGVRRHRQRRRHRHRRQREGRHAAVLRNDTPTKNHWIRLVLQGTKSNRDADRHPRRGRHVGARGRSTASGRGASACESSNDPRLLIGVGDVAELQEDHHPLALRRSSPRWRTSRSTRPTRSSSPRTRHAAPGRTSQDKRSRDRESCRGTRGRRRLSNKRPPSRE